MRKKDLCIANEAAISQASVLKILPDDLGMIPKKKLLRQFGRVENLKLSSRMKLGYITGTRQLNKNPYSRSVSTLHHQTKPRHNSFLGC